MAEERTTRSADVLYESDTALVVWWATETECLSALARKEREGAIDRAAVQACRAKLESLASAWFEMQPSEHVRSAAGRLLRVHSLRAADALQLSAALVAAEGTPAALELVTLDERLADAAAREGFPVVFPV